MGFGILFLSYFLAFFVPLSYLKVIGYAGIAWSLGKLKDYRPAFTRAVWWLIPLGVCCLYHVIGSVLALLPHMGMASIELPVFGKLVTAIVSMLECALTLCFHFVLLRELRGFALELELPAIVKKADWGLWLVGVQASTYIVALALEIAGFGLQLLSLIAFLLQFVWAIFNLINLFGCYMYICPEGDEDMERRPSRFGFVNDMRQKMDERDKLAREREAALRERKKKKKK
ncbi:MAG: hypothetical protein J6S28_07495 [Clostridia bacterium]|nr:hypothetical protein [Clostridia bacterium]MBO7297274.1 hypothetical protein [Clostridia bacterium]